MRLWVSKMDELEVPPEKETIGRPFGLRWFPTRRIQWFMVLPAVLVLAVLVVYVWSLPQTLTAGEVIDQLGVYRYPDGRKLVKITRTEAGNVKITTSQLSYRYFIIPRRTVDQFHTFEAEREWFVSVDQYQRLWLFVGRWQKEWGPNRKMPSGGTVPWVQSVLMQGLMLLESGEVAMGVNVPSSTGDWEGVPQAFFDLIPGKDKKVPVWGEVEPIPESPPKFTKKQEKKLTQKLARM
ncbi:hypothetical protein MalM14_22160 [Gimesia chilikensis]|nr:hypothetical protein MalM14_22160 [Gimesia chilikensis]